MENYLLDNVKEPRIINIINEYKHQMERIIKFNKVLTQIKRHKRNIFNYEYEQSHNYRTIAFNILIDYYFLKINIDYVERTILLAYKDRYWFITFTKQSINDLKKLIIKAANGNF